MYGYIYLTTNLVNGKRYIGQHKSQNVKDDYIGSGSIFKKAVKKYGRENFIKNILCTCSTKDELNEKEIYYIKFFDAVNSNDYYNVAKGGFTGNGLSHEQMSLLTTGEKNGMFGKHHSEETLKKISESLKGKPSARKGQHMTEESKKKLSDSMKGHKHSEEWKLQHSMDMKGRTLPDSAKKKLSEKRQGEKNPCFGKKWITNGVENKYIASTELTSYLANGWVTGRIIKNKEA